MNPEQPYREQIVLTIDDQSKVNLVMEMLSHFDLVRARREREQADAAKMELEELPLTPAERAQRFMETAGAWEGRDVDAAALRKAAWTRANSGS